MIESLERRQLRCLRAGAWVGRIGQVGSGWQNNWWESNPFNRTMDLLLPSRSYFDIPKQEMPHFWRTDVCRTKGRTFETWMLYNSKTSRDLRVITINGHVAHINLDSTAKKSSDAWETLTECFFHGYPRHDGNPHWITQNPTFEYWLTWNLNNSQICDRHVAVITTEDFDLQEKMQKCLKYWY